MSNEFQRKKLTVKLLREVVNSHADPDTAEYTKCDNDPCFWCKQAYSILNAWAVDPIYDKRKKPMIDSPITTITLTIAEANEAVEYWLSNVVFRSDVKIKQIDFSEHEHFRIKLQRNTEQADG